MARQGKQMFDNYEAKKKFVEYFQLLEDAKVTQSVFTEAVRKEFDQKIVSLEDLPTFYLTEEDIVSVYNKMLNIS